VWSGRRLPTFWINVLPPFFEKNITLINLTMEAARSSEMPVNIYQTARRYIPEDRDLHIPFEILSAAAMKSSIF
jgi:hypothetical protein